MHVVVFAAATDSTSAALMARAVDAVADQCTIVRVRATRLRHPADRARAWGRKLRRRGAKWAVDKLWYHVLERRLRTEVAQVIDQELGDHELWRHAAPANDDTWVDSARGAATASLLAGLRPDVILQNGAGLLGSEVFEIPPLGTWNLHHGYLPAIRGGDSLLWALLENRPDWIGCSLHLIDAGIDTGGVLERARIVAADQEHPGRIFARMTRVGIDMLTSRLRHVREGGLPTPLSLDGEPRGVYRSFVNGRQLQSVLQRSVRERCGS